MSRKKTKAVANHNKNNVFELSKALINNGRAIEEGPKRKTWSKHDLRAFRALTSSQQEMCNIYWDNYNVCSIGTTGTGKSYVAFYLALTEVFNESSPINNIVVVRSIVATRNPGFLKGDLNEKVEPHEAAYHGILQKLIGKSSTYQDMKDAHLIKFVPTCFVRGDTWDNCVIIIDEFQNMTFHEFDSVITRIGKNCKVFILGDGKQTDLLPTKVEHSGFHDIIRIIPHIEEFGIIEFSQADIVRGGLVKSWIKAKENLGY